MHALTASDLLNIWEECRPLLPLQRGLTLLLRAYQDKSQGQLAEYSIGQRNGRLLQLREALFGPRFVSQVLCPACQEPMELTFMAGDITGETCVPGNLTEALSVQSEGYQVVFRLPNSNDLASVQDAEDTAALRAWLLTRCLLAVHFNGTETDVANLPAEIVAEVVDRMQQSDPLANIQLALTCPSCGYEWLAQFDIASYLWRELEAWAVRMLRDVHRLASVYNWSERDILQLTPWRRQIYLDLIER